MVSDRAKSISLASTINGGIDEIESNCFVDLKLVFARSLA